MATSGSSSSSNDDSEDFDVDDLMESITQQLSPGGGGKQFMFETDDKKNGTTAAKTGTQQTAVRDANVDEQPTGLGPKRSEAPTSSSVSLPEPGAALSRPGSEANLALSGPKSRPTSATTRVAPKKPIRVSVAPPAPTDDDPSRPRRPLPKNAEVKTFSPAAGRRSAAAAGAVPIPVAARPNSAARYGRTEISVAGAGVGGLHSSVQSGAWVPDAIDNDNSEDQEITTGGPMTSTFQTFKVPTPTSPLPARKLGVSASGVGAAAVGGSIVTTHIPPPPEFADMGEEYNQQKGDIDDKPSTKCSRMVVWPLITSIVLFGGGLGLTIWGAMCMKDKDSNSCGQGINSASLAAILVLLFGGMFMVCGFGLSQVAYRFYHYRLARKKEEVYGDEGYDYDDDEEEQWVEDPADAVQSIPKL